MIKTNWEEEVYKAKKAAVASPNASVVEVGTVSTEVIQSEVAILKTQMSQLMEIMTLLSDRIATGGEFFKTYPDRDTTEYSH